MTPPLLELTGISKGYGGLRPLRIERLTVTPAERLLVLGFDRPMAEVFVNLVTGTSLPDHGTVVAFGRPTSAVSDSADWLALVDRFGIVSDRVVMLEGMTAIQNLALSFTLDIEPPTGDARQRAEELAREVGLPESSWHLPIGGLDGLARACLRLARAVALDPALLLLEHSTSAVDAGQAADFGARLHAVASRRSAAVVALSADEAIAETFPGRALRLDPASGKVAGRTVARRWFGRRSG